MLEKISWVSLVAACVFLGGGLIGTYFDYRIRKDTAEATKVAVNSASNVDSNGDNLVEQNSVSDLVESVTGFASAMKDLDSAARLMVVGVWLLGVASLAAGIETVASVVQ